MLEILSAKYGAVGSEKDMKDVLPQVIQKISADKISISFIVSSTELGLAEDPAPGSPKELVVKYALNGKENTEHVKDGNTFAAKVAEEPKLTYTGFTVSLYASIWQNLAGSIVLFFQVFSVGLAYGLGSYFGNGIVWAIVSVLFPYAAFWLIAAIVIIKRALSSADFIRPMY